MQMKDLISSDKWKKFGADFNDHSGMTAYAYDAAGDHVIEKRRWANQLCPIIRGGEPHREESVCAKSHKAMAELVRKEGKIIVGTCQAGLLNIALPVFVGNDFAGIVGGCGLLPPKGEVDADVVNAITGMEKNAATTLGQNIRRLSPEEIETQVRYLEDRVLDIVARYKEGYRKTKTRTFKSLIRDVQRKGRCHQCGACVTFCTAMNYGALELSETGRPMFRDPNKCIECGVCYMICPAVDDLNEMLKAKVGWQPPLGRTEQIGVFRARDEALRTRATDGGTVTAILSHLFEEKLIDGAAVTRQAGPFKRIPWLATDADQVIESAGSSFDFSVSGAISLYAQDYSTYSPSMRMLGPATHKGLSNVAVVGTPCQINAVRKMETLGVVPSQSVYCLLGLFCSGGYVFGDKRREKIERIGNFSWEEVDKINIRDRFLVRLKNGEQLSLPLDELDFVKRKACRYCDDYTSEFADLSFGGIGAPEGWTTVIARTAKGVKILEEAKETVLEQYDEAPDAERMITLREVIEWHSAAKKESAAQQLVKLPNGR